MINEVFNKASKLKETLNFLKKERKMLKTEILAVEVKEDYEFRQNFNVGRAHISISKVYILGKLEAQLKENESAIINIEKKFEKL